MVDNEVVSNTKFNTLKTNVNNLDKKIPDATTLIYITKFRKRNGDIDKKILDCNCFEYKN